MVSSFKLGRALRACLALPVPLARTHLHYTRARAGDLQWLRGHGGTVRRARARAHRAFSAFGKMPLLELSQHVFENCTRANFGPLALLYFKSHANRSKNPGGASSRSQSHTYNPNIPVVDGALLALTFTLSKECPEPSQKENRHMPCRPGTRLRHDPWQARLMVFASAPVHPKASTMTPQSVLRMRTVN